MSARPASLRLATTFDPMNPAPPVTNNIDAVRPVEVGSAFRRLLRSFALIWLAEQHWTAPPWQGIANSNVRKR
jgi:hypothetical protein